ncbi:hypothetical protein ABPG75_009148 [Micractinium tetrahymenae]
MSGTHDHSSPLLADRSSQLEGTSPRIIRSEGSGTAFYRLPTFPRNISICQLAGGGSEEENAAHKRLQRKLIAALILAFIFMIVEVVGGIMAHSLAIITDAAHLLSDVSGFAVAALAAYWAKRRSQSHFSYGYHRMEVLGALASVMTVWLVTGILLFEAVQRIITPEHVDGKLMFIIAVVGVCVNVAMLFILGHHHGHGHGGCSHSHDPSNGHSQGHAHNHAHGANGCSGHGREDGSGHGKGAAKRQLAPVLESAELSRSSSRADDAPAAQPHTHPHGEGEHCSHSHGHDHSHSHGDLEAAEEGHSHSHGDLEAAEEGHSHSHGDLEAAEEGHSHSHHGHSSDEEEHHHHPGGSGGETPILKTGGQRSCSGHGHGHGHGNRNGEHSHGAGGSNGGEVAVAAAAVETCGGGSGGNGAHEHDHSNLNVRGAIIHVIGDFVQSVGVAIAGALIWWHQDNPSWYIADPICTFLFAALVLWTTRAILRDIADVLMERVPRGLCIKTIHDDLSRVSGVEEVHDLHVWSLTPGIPLLCAHVNLSPEADPTAVLHTMTAYCRGIGIDHTTIQLVVNGSACPCVA